MPGTLMIHYGLPGTGKSLFSMQDVVVPAVKQHRPFFTNITGVSLSGLSAVCGVHQTEIRYYPVDGILDVLKYFDDDTICHNGVFILDEMKDFVDNADAISWLESRINVMRKQTVDFVLIAQQPEKEYIHPNIIKLADSCNVFVSRKAKGDTTHVDEYFCDGGFPRIVNKVPKNAAGKKVRYKDPIYFSCYKTSESAFYNGEEDKTYNGLMWYQTRKAKFIFALVAIAFIVVVLVVKSVFSVKDITELSSKKGTKQNEQEQNVYSGTVASVPPGEVASAETGQDCFEYLLCDETMCESNLGIHPPETYNTTYNFITVDGVPVYKCKGGSLIPDGGRLLHPGK